MIKKDFRYRSLQPLAILDNKLKIFISIFFNFSSSFFENFFHLNISLACVFPDLFISFNYSIIIKTIIKKPLVVQGIVTVLSHALL